MLASTEVLIAVVFGWAFAMLFDEVDDIGVVVSVFLTDLLLDGHHVCKTRK